MSQTADLEHLFQLEQILSLGSDLREWSNSGDDSQGSDLSYGSKQITKPKQSNSSAIEPYSISTTSFDPGGDDEIETGKNEEEKVSSQEDSDPGNSNHLRSSENSDNNIPSLSVLRNEKEILSYASTNGGRCIAFIALTGNDTNNIPQLCSIMLKPNLHRANSGLDSYRHGADASDCFEPRNGSNMKVSVYHVPWYDHGDSSADGLSCVTLSEEKNICLVSCRDGSLFLLPLNVIFPGFQPDCSNIPDGEDTETKLDDLFHYHFPKAPFEIFPIPRPLYYQRANPTALVIWSTSEFTVGIIGTLQRKVIAVDLQNGKEVRLSLH